MITLEPEILSLIRLDFIEDLRSRFIQVEDTVKRLTEGTGVVRSTVALKK